MTLYRGQAIAEVPHGGDTGVKICPEVQSSLGEANTGWVERGQSQIGIIQGDAIILHISHKNQPKSWALNAWDRHKLI